MLIAIGLLITIFAWWPNLYVPFEVPKVIVFNWFVRILSLYFIYDLFRKKRLWKIDIKLTIIISIFLAWVFVTSILGLDTPKSFLGNYYRKDGILTLINLIGFSFLLSYFWNENYKKLISHIFLISSLILSVFVIFKINTTFGNPIYLAGFLSVSLPFSYYLFKLTNNKLYILGSVFIILAIFSMYVIGTILTVLLFLILIIFFQIKSKLKYIIALLIALLAIIIFNNWVRDYQINNSKVLIFEGRERIFISLIKAVIKRPIIGYGWANVDYAFESSSWPINLNNDVYLDKAHSEILEVLVTTGVIGLIIYLIIILFVINKTWMLFRNTKDNWYLTIFMILILFIFHSQTNIVSITEQIIFWSCVGLNLLDLKKV